MRLLHLTDLHFNREACRWLQAQDSFDLICISGDLFDSSLHASLSLPEQVDWYRILFSELATPVFICSGNHDISETEWSNNPPFITTDNVTTNWVSKLAMPGVHTDNSIVTVNGWKIGCIRYETNDYTHFADCDILLHHEPPKGSKTARQSGQDWGSKTLTDALNSGVIAPRYLLCGHVHRPQSNAVKRRGVVVVNPGGSKHGAIPNHKVITLPA